MHPSTALIAWLAAVLASQFLGYAGLGLLALGILLALPAAAGTWLKYVRRARWLLVTLWLILAYNTPGEAWRDLAWAPTYEGIADANLQAVRLLVMLACLAWLFCRLGRDGLVSALWGLLQPLHMRGADTRALVVRLSLVLDNLQEPPEKGAWRKVLASGGDFAAGPDSMTLSLPRWQLTDSLTVLAVASVFAWIVIA
jgi:energy-coupling factor transporter transmembrane protein EcfT